MLIKKLFNFLSKFHYDSVFNYSKKLNFEIIGTRKDYYESKNDREDAYVLNLNL